MANPIPREQETFKLSSLILSVYLPTFLFAIGQGAVLPIIPLFALELGASVAAASAVVGARGLGLMLFDVPSGLAVSRFGDKGAMVAGTAMVAVVAVGASLSRSVPALAVLMLIMGGGWSFWQVARLAYISEITPNEQRGRAIALLGGMQRVGNIIGPILGGLLGRYFGLGSAFYAQAALGLAAAAMMFVVVREGSGSENLGGHGIVGRLFTTVVEQRKIILSAGLAAILIQVVHQGRDVFLPLWGKAIGLDVARIGLVIGIASLVDAALFYPAGYIMDRWGRKRASVPSLLILSLGFLALPATTDVHGYALVAILIGVGHGLGAGLVTILGADFAPALRRGEFLGVWRLINDCGNAGGPFTMSLIIASASLGLASICTAGLGLAGTMVMWLFVPETLRRSAAHIPGEPTLTGAKPLGAAEPARSHDQSG